MFSKKIFIFSIFILVFISLSSVSATDSGTFSDLADLIINSSSDTVELTKNYTYNSEIDSAYSKGIVINKSISINGNNYTLNGNNKAKILVFDNYNTSVVLNNIRFINSKQGVYSVCEDISVYNCYFENNVGDSASFASYGRGLTELINSTFINNTNTYTYGSGGAARGTNMTVDNCVFIHNNGSYGGALNLYDGKVNNSFFKDNIGKSGGALDSYTINTVENSVFINNTAIMGGAIQGAVIVYNSSFINNSADDGAVIYSNTYNLYKAQSSKFIKSIFTGNIAFNTSIFYLNEYNSSVSYSFIYNNSNSNGKVCFFRTTNNLSFDFNWWGLNEVKSLLVDSNGKTYTPETWVLVNFTSSDDSTLIDDTIVLTVDLSNYYNKTSNLIRTLTDSLPSIPIILTIDDIGEEYNISNNSCFINYIASSIGEFNISCKVQDEIFNKTLIIADNEADLSISITCDNLAPIVTSIVTYTVTVKNNGPNTAVKLKVFDILPASLTYISDDTGNYDSNTGVWTIGVLKKDETINLNLKAQVKEIATITNKVNISTINNDLNLEDNSAEVSITSTGVYDLSIKLNSTSISPIKDDTIILTVTVINEGQLDVTNVNVNINTPTGLTYLSDDSNGEYDSNTGIWTIGAMTTLNKELKITYMVTSEDTLNIGATVSLTETDNNLEDNTQELIINPQCDLSLTISFNETSPDINSRVESIVTVTNNGPYAAENTKVYLTIPSNLDYLFDDSDETFNNNIWTIGDLNVNEVKTLTITFLTKTKGTVSLNGTVLSNLKDPDTTNNVFNSILSIKPVSDLSVSITGSSSVVETQSITLLVTVTNNGPSDASNIKTQISIPEGLKLVSFYSDGDNDDYNTDTNTWTIDSLEYDYFITLSLICTATNPGIMYITANTTLDEKDNNLEDNFFNKTLTVENGADLNISIVSNSSITTVEDEFNFTVIITNNGPSSTSIRSFTINTDNMEILNYTSPGNKIYYSDSGRVRGWRVDGELASGESASVSLTIKISKVGEISLSSYISPTLNEINSADNEFKLSINSLSLVDIETKVSSSTENPEILDLVSYTVTVKNKGKYSASNVEVRISYDDGLVYKNYGLSTGAYSYTTHRWVIGTLNPNTSESLTINLTCTQIGNLTFLANASTQSNDYNLVNNYFNKSIIVSNIKTVINISDIETYINTPISVTGTVNTLIGSILIEIFNNTEILDKQTVNINSRGSFTGLFDSLDSGEYLIRLTYNDTTAQHSSTVKEINLKVTNPYIPINPINRTNTTNITNTTNSTPINNTNTTNNTNITPINPTNTTNNTNTSDNTSYINTTTPILITTNLSKVYGETGNFVGQLLDRDGKALAGQHVFVTLTRLSSGASKTYQTTTDYLGFYTLEINLAPGSYKAESMYNNLHVGDITYKSYNTTSLITVKSSSDTKNSTFILQSDLNKVYGESGNLVGRLVDGNGEPLIGMHIGITLTRLSNGASKTYWTTCDYKGEFILTINLAPGLYSALSTFEGNTIYDSTISKNIINITRI